MKRIALTVLLALAPRAFAWSPATHVHLAELATGSTRPEMHFGSMLPDMNHAVLGKPEVFDALRHLGHYESERLAPSCLALGMLTHNEAWGADWYSHQYWLPQTPENAGLYSTAKIRQLEAAFEVNPGHAEFLFEFAVDYLLRLEKGPVLGQKLLASALAFGPAQQQLLVDAFAAPLTQLVPGLSLDDAKAEVRGATNLYRFVTKVYGTAFVQDEVAVFDALVTLTALYLSIDRQAAEEQLLYAVALCEDDYRAELDRIGDLLRTDIAVYAPEMLAVCAAGGCLGPAGDATGAGLDPVLGVLVALGIAMGRNRIRAHTRR